MNAAESTVNNIKLSIIIVNFNTEKLLFNCLKSIFCHPCSEKFEVLVVDNASTDGSIEMVRKSYPQVRLICNQKNVGFARANNQGIRESKGTYVLLLNSDTEIVDRALQNMMEFMDRHIQVGAIGCQLISADGNPQPFTYGKDPTLLYLVHRILRMFIRRKYLHSWSGEDPIRTDWVTGACMMVRRKAIDDAGYLDENIFMYFEDNDWCYRMRKRGWKIYFLPQIKIVHLGGQSLGEDDPRRKINYYKSLIYFYKKHYTFSSQICLQALLFFYRTLLARQIDKNIKRAKNE